MGRTMIAALIAVGMLTGCTDWREGSETVEACVERFALKKGAVHPLADDPGQWVPSYTFDVTKMGAENLRDLINASDAKARTAESGIIAGGGSDVKAREAFEDTPASEAGVLLIAEDPALFKVRGKPGLHRELIRQGCEGQRAGMRLISFTFTREDALVDGELPQPEIKPSELRKIVKPAISTEDILP